MSRSHRLLIVLVLNLVLITTLIAVGVTAHSLGVLAAGGDYLVDSGAIVVALLAIWLRNRPIRPGSRDFRDAPAYAALINAALLLTVVILVAVEAIQRLTHPTEPVDGLPVVIASATAAAIMIIAALVLGDDDELDQDTDADRANMRAVLLDTIADAAAATGVAVTGTVIAITHGWYWLDPTVALAIALLIAYQTINLFQDITATRKAWRAPRN